MPIYFAFDLRRSSGRHIFCHTKKNKHCYETMNIIWMNFVAVLNPQCQNVWSAPHFITLNVSICTIQRWTITRRKFCMFWFLYVFFVYICADVFFLLITFRLDCRATCVYLACKTEEFNVSIGQFVGNIKGDRGKAMDIILSNELLLMQRLNYYLTVHNPYRPVEGFLIDIKTRCTLANPDRLRKGIDEFLEKTFFTEACLLFAPSQIALAAVLHSASKQSENLDSYVTESLIDSRDKLPVLIEAVRKIRFMVKNFTIPEKDEFKRIEKKLDKCRNQENNPDSEAWVQFLT